MAAEQAPKLKQKGDPESYIKLAKLSQGLQEFQIAISACEKGLAKFPQNPGLLVARGETLVLAYNQGKKAEHLKSAVDSFEEALKINPHNYIATFLSGQIYLQFKKYQQAEEKFAAILEIDPNDGRAKQMWEKAKKMLAPAPQEPKGAEPAKPTQKTAPQGPEAEEDKDEAPGDQKEGMWPIAEEDDSANHEFLISRLGLLSKIEGLQSLVLIDKNGNAIRAYKKSKLDPDLLASMAGNIYRSTKRVNDRFRIGDFVYSMVMSQNVFIYIVDVRWGVLIIETRVDTNQEVVEKKINQYLGELNL